MTQHLISTEGWQPIETAPRDGSRLLIWSDDEGRVQVAAWNAEFGVFDADYGAWWEVTDCSHWMPLPTPPAGEQA